MNAGKNFSDPLLVQHQNTIRHLSAEHGALRPRVFGSRARGTADTSSDLDIVVEFETGRDLLDLIALKQDLEDLLGCSVDVVTDQGLSPHVREHILRDARPL